jgi:hypothetical protein
VAVPKAVARSLKKSATRLSTVQDATVREAGTRAIEQAPQYGRRFFQGRYPLYAEVVQKRSSKKRSEVLVWPRPTGGWIIASNGRGPVRPVRKTVLRAGVKFFPFARATSKGDKRLQRWHAAVTEGYGDVGQERLREALDGS